MSASQRRKGQAEWLDVTIADGKYSRRYQVSSDGDVRAHPDARIGGMVPGKVLFQSKDDRGYPQVQLWMNCVPLSVKVHRLVAEAFLGAREAGMTINHMDGDKTNNFVGNLEYVTNQENIRHAHRVLNDRAYVIVRGQRMSLCEAVDLYGVQGVTSQAVRRRYKRLGWPIEKALQTPIQPTGRPRRGQIPA